MRTNNVGLITTGDMATILVGAALAFARSVELSVCYGGKLDTESMLVLFANALTDLGHSAPTVRAREVYALAGQGLMATESADE